MKTYKIETIEQWNIRKTELLTKGYRARQFQYGWDSPEGFHVWFFNGRADVEFYTFNQPVEKAMIEYNGEIKAKD
jgi:hypothetical protein